jgi:sulfur carrier protein ThiS
MANNVIAQVLGGAKQVLDNVNSISDLKQKLNLAQYTATLNGSPAADDENLTDGDFVTLSQAVKGG